MEYRKHWSVGLAGVATVGKADIRQVPVRRPKLSQCLLVIPEFIRQKKTSSPATIHFTRFKSTQ